jgi:hypothetical protein
MVTPRPFGIAPSIESGEWLLTSSPTYAMQRSPTLTRLPFADFNRPGEHALRRSSTTRNRYSFVGCFHQPQGQDGQHPSLNSQLRLSHKRGKPETNVWY